LSKLNDDDNDVALLITQCYLSPDTSEHTPPQPQPDRLVLNLRMPEGWKAELT